MEPPFGLLCHSESKTKLTKHMTKVITIQHYRTLHEFASAFHLKSLPKPRQDWRLLKDPCVGEVNGIPTMRGVATATNGILAAIVRGGTIVFGHIEYFIVDSQERETLAKKLEKENKPTSSKPEVDISEFV